VNVNVGFKDVFQVVAQPAARREYYCAGPLQILVSVLATTTALTQPRGALNATQTDSMALIPPVFRHDPVKGRA
jgi:hypothetical protein